jgi:hypothetical protein
MPRSNATRTAAPSKDAFRPVLVPSGTPCQALTPEAEVRMLRAELSRVRKELRDLTWATRAFIRYTL